MKNLMMMLGISVMLMSCAWEPNCNINDKNLTPETRTGANTMSCKIDGQVFMDHIDEHGDCRGGIFAYSENNKTNIYLRAYNINDCAKLNGEVEIYIDTNVYIFHNNIKRYRLLSVSYNSNNLIGAKVFKGAARYYTDSKNSINESWVELTRNDTTAKIISGRFEFVAYPGNPNLKPIRVTEGRFDWTYPFSSECPLRF